MHRRGVNRLLMGLCWLGITHPVQAQNQVSVEMQQQISEVAKLLEGKMDTTTQAVVNSKRPSVQMTTCRVNVNAAKASEPTIFLYQEQALTIRLAEPYRQRLLAISATPSRDSVQSLALKLVNPKQWIGICEKPESQRRFEATDLDAPVCTVYLKRSPGGYVGKTPSQGCPANVRGAVRITNTIELNPEGMNTWDRGFDANGKQVWGAESEAYQFRRTTNRRPEVRNP